MSHRVEVVWLHALSSKKDLQKYIVCLQQSRDGLQLKACDFKCVWSKMYETTVSAGMEQLKELSDCLHRGTASVAEMGGMKGTLKMSWGEHEAELVSQPEVAMQLELQDLLLHAVEQMNSLKQNVQVLERKLGKEKLSSPISLDSNVVIKSGPGTKSKRLPGQSIINPSNKRKKAAGGVQFSDD